MPPPLLLVVFLAAGSSAAPPGARCPLRLPREIAEAYGTAAGRRLVRLKRDAKACYERLADQERVESPIECLSDGEHLANRMNHLFPEVALEFNRPRWRRPGFAFTLAGCRAARSFLRAPAPSPTEPAPEPSPAADEDAIDLSQAVIHNSPQDVARWAKTATIKTLDLARSGVHIDFTKRDGPGSWPDVPFLTPREDLQYTLWILLKIDGRWHASGCIQYWRGLERNGGPPDEYAKNWYYAADRWGPMTGRQPRPGEEVGFMVAAGDHRNNGAVVVKERSNVVVVPFPTASGRTFNFTVPR